MRLVAGRDQEIAQWVGARVGIEDFGLCVTMAIETNAGELIAGVVLNNYRPAVGLEVTMASSSPRWCSRAILRGVFGYVFKQVGCRRLTAITEAKNQPVKAFLCHLGFREEGVLRCGFPTDDAVVYGMLREECRWLDDRNGGCGA